MFQTNQISHLSLFKLGSVISPDNIKIRQTKVIEPAIMRSTPQMRTYKCICCITVMISKGERSQWSDVWSDKNQNLPAVGTLCQTQRLNISTERCSMNSEVMPHICFYGQTKAENRFQQGFCNSQSDLTCGKKAEALTCLYPTSAVLT